MKDKKKLIALGALVLVIVSVGVFQFVSAGSNAPAPAVAKKEEKKAPEPQQAEAPKNSLFAQALPARDPFQATASLPQQPPPQQKPEPPRPQQPAPQLPPVQIDKTGGFSGTAPVMIQRAPEAMFEFSLSGIMLGAKPMAVFTDPQGNQRLVLLGGSLDPDSKVVSIDKDAVTVRFHGKNLRLTVEGNPNAK